jgi:uncharacterized membrane protein
MDYDEVLQSPFFWIITAVGYGAFIMMLMILKGMGDSSIMPLWVKIVTLLFIPVAGYVFTMIMGDD